MIYEEERKLVRKSPYNYILDYAESKLIVVGKQAMKILALQPQSLYLPDISNNIIGNITSLIVGEPASGKSSICKIVSGLCLNPVIRRVITEADLIATASELKMISIIIEDLTQSVTNEGYGLIKVLEGICGEEKSVSKSTMTTNYTEEVKGIGLFGITPQDLETFSKQLETGLFSRCVLVLLRLERNDYKKIAEFMTLKAGDIKHKEDVSIKSEVVKDFYNELLMIQRGKHEEYLKKVYGENHKEKIICPIVGYDISINFKKELLDKWNRISNKMLDQGQKPNNRDLSTYYKFLVSSAFLNIHNRKYEGGILVPNEDDHKIALSLSLENMRWKWALPLALKYNRKISNLDALEKLLNNGIPEVVRDILINISPYGKYLKDELNSTK